MKRRELHLIDANGDPVSSAIRSAVEATFDYSVAEHPEIDRAILANMAEQLAVSMEENKESIASVRRYAYAAMRGKVRDWLRTKEATELAVGLGPELDKCARANHSFQGEVDRKILFIGPISSIYDFLTFAVLSWVFHASKNEALFHTGWFVESLATQTLVVFVIRTTANPLKSRPSWPLLISVLTVVAIATALPYTPLGRFLRFTPLPLSLLGAIALLAVTYLFLVQLVKSWFYRRHALL